MKILGMLKILRGSNEYPDWLPWGSSVQVTVFFVVEDMQKWLKTVNWKSYVYVFISFYLLSNKDFFSSLRQS